MTAAVVPSPACASEECLVHARVLVELGEIREAESKVAAALDQRPHDPEALSLFAKIKHIKGELSQAVGCWAELLTHSPHAEIALLRLRSMLELARDPERGAGEFVAVGQFQLWRKPAADLELEAAFRLFLSRQPDEAQGACDALARKYRGSDPELFKLAVLAKAWIAELAGDTAAACRILEGLGRERGFETDLDRAMFLVRVYERLGTPEALAKAVHVCHYLERSFGKLSILGRLASLYRRLGRPELAAGYDEDYLLAFRRRMHRPTFAEVVRVAARQYLPIAKLQAVRLDRPQGPDELSARERALALILERDLSGASGLLLQGGTALDRKYLADIAALAGDAERAVQLYLESLGDRPDDLRVVGWLLEYAERTGDATVARFFSNPGTGEATLQLLDAARRAAPLSAGLWRQLASLHGLLGRADEAARCLQRAERLAAAASRQRHPVGRVLVAAVYHFFGKAKGITHEVWVSRRPAQAGRGGFLEEILGNLTPEMRESVRNTFVSVREYARSKFPHRTSDIADYDYSYKVTKEDEPSGGLSAGLPSALAFLSVFLDRPVPNDVASSGVLIADSHDVLVAKPVGEAEFKVRGAYNRNLRMLILPEGNRRDLEDSPQVPGVVCREIVRYASSLDEAVSLTFGEDIWG